MEIGEEWGGHDEDAGGWKDPRLMNELFCYREEGIKKKRNAPKLPVERVPPCLQKRVKNGAWRLSGAGQDPCF